jgi:SsrA-binding protein
MTKPDFKSPRIENRKVFHDYFIEDKLECGIALVGSEVKSLRMGLAQLAEAYGDIQNGELWLLNAYIDPYKQSAIVYNHEPRRPRRLLVHRREIRRLAEQVDRSGMTLVPVAIYFKEGRVKVELGVARGKKAHDKRASIRKKEADRDLRRATMKRM